MATQPVAEIDDKTRYETLKRELALALPKKRESDKNLAQIESHIYKLEGQYLTETIAQHGGNIIHGFDNFLKNQTTGRKRYEVADQDRVFSNSSLTIQKSLDLLGEVSENEDNGKLSAGGVTTVTVPPATQTQTSQAHANKLIRDREYSRKKRAQNRNRSAGTVSDDDSVSVATSTGRPRKRPRMADD
ncbi:histone acetyltransferase subunit NuA4-domain-containing protein [Armillaria mellea]|nr:histone acetyltransferase subunit NuA4-domain-containing protein [Armillaria mellea]